MESHFVYLTPVTMTYYDVPIFSAINKGVVAVMGYLGAKVAVREKQRANS